MTIDKNYFLNKLNEGESIDAIGQAIADMMNAAVQEYETEKVRAAHADRKREIMKELCALIEEYGKLENVDEDFDVTDEDIEALMKAFEDMFKTIKELKKIAGALDHKIAIFDNKNVKPTLKEDLSDDEILANFLKMLS
jgi:FMN phosphatase YigB (HAD superfamily)